MTLFDLVRALECNMTVGREWTNGVQTLTLQRVGKIRKLVVGGDRDRDSRAHVLLDLYEFPQHWGLVDRRPDTGEIFLRGVSPT